MQNINTKFINWLDRAMNRKGLNATKLAELSGVSRPSVSRVLNKNPKTNKRPPFEFCHRVATPLGYSPNEVAKMAGFNISKTNQEAKKPVDQLSKVVAIAETLSLNRLEELLGYAEYLEGKQASDKTEIGLSKTNGILKAA